LSSAGKKAAGARDSYLPYVPNVPYVSSVTFLTFVALAGNPAYARIPLTSICCGLVDMSICCTAARTKWEAYDKSTRAWHIKMLHDLLPNKSTTKSTSRSSGVRALHLVRRTELHDLRPVNFHHLWRPHFLFPT